MPADKRSPSSGGVTGWRPDGGYGLEAATELLTKPMNAFLGSLVFGVIIIGSALSMIVSIVCCISADASSYLFAKCR